MQLVPRVCPHTVWIFLMHRLLHILYAFRSIEFNSVQADSSHPDEDYIWSRVTRPKAHSPVSLTSRRARRRIRSYSTHRAVACPALRHERYGRGVSFQSQPTRSLIPVYCSINLYLLHSAPYQPQHLPPVLRYAATNSDAEKITNTSLRRCRCIFRIRSELEDRKKK